MVHWIVLAGYPLLTSLLMMDFMAFCTVFRAAVVRHSPDFIAYDGLLDGVWMVRVMMQCNLFAGWFCVKVV